VEESWAAGLVVVGLKIRRATRLMWLRLHCRGAKTETYSVDVIRCTERSRKSAIDGNGRFRSKEVQVRLGGERSNW